MASRHIYKDGVDFAALALQSPDFAKRLKPNNQLDFTDPDAVRQLTESLLQTDFHLKVNVPGDRLCPPVPNRGTGCCSIYPLLGCTMRPRWKFIATDIDDKNIQEASKAVSSNGLESRIQIFKTAPDGNLVPLDIDLVEKWVEPAIKDVGVLNLTSYRLDFTMCNPPFYASREEMIASAEEKERPPFSACTGAEVEMVTPGGEVAFVSRMIEESLQLRERVLWYTSMLGKLSSVSVLVENLIEHGNHNYAVTEFVQGNRTRRWAIAWSWTDLRPTVGVARGIAGFPKHLLPFPSEYTFEIPTSSVDKVGESVDEELKTLHLQWTWRKSLSMGVGFAQQNVWSRQYRRKMKLAAAQENVEPDQSTAALGFKVQLTVDAIEEKTVRVIVRWFKGTDTVLFESFCGMLKRKLEGR